MAAIAKIPGVELVLGDETYIMPPLSINALIQLKPRIDAFMQSEDPTDIESLKTVVDAAHAALVRNYPEIKPEFLGDVIDLGNMQDVLQCVMDVSGALRKAQESGERKPGQG
ncbi:hypothetical protein IHQ56_02750 [Methylobacillus flagellatus]|nr:hypothetical protein [Methylobacillus flagellatus]